MDRLEGIYCALWTPADRTGEILWSALEKHLSFILDSGVQGIMALGSTGEFIHLSLEQRRALLERVVRLCRPRGRQVIANVSDVQIRNVVHLARHAMSAGAACVAVLPPYFFPLEQRDLAEFFIEAGRLSDAPLALYNFPEVTGKRIAPETIRRVARAVRVVAVKQSGAEFEYHAELLALGKELGFAVLTGSDTRLEEALQLGCSGAISGLANSVPEALCRIFVDFKSGLASPAETAHVAELARRMRPLSFPLNVKSTVAARGFETGEPKMPVSTETLGIYKKVREDLIAWFAQQAGPSISRQNVNRPEHSLDASGTARVDR